MNYRKKYVILLLLIPLLLVHPGDGMDTASPIKTDNTIIPTQLSPLDNIDKIVDYLNRSQDRGGDAIAVMDDAFYLAKSIEYYESLTSFTFPQSLKNQLINFVNHSRNDDGSFGNWEGAPGSLESTFHGISVLQALNKLDIYSVDQYQDTIDFIQSLITPSAGYFPLPDWDVPDMTSTYRALVLKKDLAIDYPSLNITSDPDVLNYVEQNYIPPVFINSGSGYAEITNGTAELPASTYAFLIYDLLDLSSPQASNVVKFLSSLVSPSGGVSNIASNTPTTGYTSLGLQLYLSLNQSKYGGLVQNSTLSTTFAQNIIQFLKSTRIAGSGFGTSPTDPTAELSSTYFVLKAIELLTSINLTFTMDLSNIDNYLIIGKQPLFGIGDYPGDNSELSYTSRALAIAKLLNRTEWINDGVEGFVSDSYDPQGGFGFRPGGKPRAKYTYYGVKALRNLNFPVEQRFDIINYVLSTQNDDGGFGEQPGSTISYITHTYWAIATLKLLGVNLQDELDINQITLTLSFYENSDGMFSNYPGQNSSLVSTFRALQVYDILQIPFTRSKALNSTLLMYQKASGGFIQRQTETIPTMEATFYGLSLAQRLGTPINITNISTFINSLQNQDGGYGIKPRFSSRITSTFFAIASALLIKKPSKDLLLAEEVKDIFSPLIYPAFNPAIDTNRTIQGTETILADIVDPETGLDQVWVETLWSNGQDTVSDKFSGYLSPDDPFIWLIPISVENADGVLKFRIIANDTSGNQAITEWFSLLTQEFTPSINSSGGPSIYDILLLMPLIILMSSVIDGGITYVKRKNSNESDVKMEITDEDQENDPVVGFNVILIFLLMFFISYLSRLFLSDAILVLENSIFLFRFLIAAVFILFARYVVGLRTFGFFGTSVLAVSWLQLGPLLGLVVFMNFFVLSYTVRKNLSPYNLAIGFRIAILMVFSISTVGLFELIGEIFRINFLSSAIFLPIIITPWLVDRYVVEEEENNMADAFIRLVTTVLVIAGCYYVMAYDPLIRFVALTPEVWLILVTVIFYTGRSRKYSLMDLRRFKRLVSDDDPPLSMMIRNRDYISRYNNSVLFPMINKFRLKEQFDKWRVPASTIYGVINDENSLGSFMKRLKTEEMFESGFVIKPSESYGGRGIVLVKNRTSDGNFTIGSTVYSPEAVKGHIRKILDGEFLTSQTSNVNDICIIEELIVPDEDFGSIGVGLSDIRLIIFKGIVVMAMSRIPTHESGGLANLKQGAIGAGINLATGKIFHAEYKQNPVTIHPDTHMKIVGYQFSNWMEIMAIGCLAQKSTGLGYAGVDLVLGQNGRVYVLEVNKRPGLEIQNINLSGLVSSLDYIEEHEIDGRENSPQKCAKLSVELYKTMEEKK